MSTTPYFLRNPALDDAPPPMAPPTQAPMAPVDPTHAMTAPLGPTHDAAQGMMQAASGMMAPATEGAAASPQKAAPKPMAAKQSPLQDQEDKAQSKLMGDYAKDADPYGSPDNHPGFFGKLLHGLNHATGGDTRRQWEENTLSKGIQGIEAEKSKEGVEGATAGHLNEETSEMPGKTQSEEGLQRAQQGNLESETNLRNNPPTTLEHFASDDGYFSFNPKTGEVKPLTLNGQPIKPTQKLSYETVKGPDGQPHTYAMDSRGNKVIDEGQHYEKPAVSVNENHEFAENERGRGLLDKAETQFRTAQQGAQGIRAAVDDANAGGKMSARMLPLEGALEITTANGVHRINRTEVDQYAGGGNLYDQLAGKLRGVTEGVPFTPEIMNDMKRLADLQEKGAYDNYRGAYDSATKRYHLTDEQALPAPRGTTGAGTEPQRPANVPEGYTFKDGPKGKGWYAPAAAAR